jgi:hypothetical protein
MERKNYIKKKKKEKSLIDFIYFWGRIRSSEYQSGSRAVKTNKRKNFFCLPGSRCGSRFRIRIRINYPIGIRIRSPGYNDSNMLISYTVELSFMLYEIRICVAADPDPGFGVVLTPWIRDGKNSNPGSGINIADPQH